MNKEKAMSLNSNGKDKKSYSLEASNSSFDWDINNELNLRELWNTIIRRKRIIFFSSSTIFLLSLITIAHSRIFKPIYKGSFSILISDPMSSQSINTGNEINQGSLKFEALARNRTTND